MVAAPVALVVVAVAGPGTLGPDDADGLNVQRAAAILSFFITTIGCLIDPPYPSPRVIAFFPGTGISF